MQLVLLLAMMLLQPVLTLADMADVQNRPALPAANASAGPDQLNLERKWDPLSDDKLHDPGNPALKELQQPQSAFAGFPRDFPSIGNQVDWVRALETGVIQPRTNIFPDTNIEVLDLDIIMPRTSQMPMVRFPHRAHTQWLDCTNCHDGIFKKKAGATPVNMFAILAGEYCGRCHGAVAFPLTECRRCHSEPRRTFKGDYGPQPAPGRVFEPVMQQKPFGINE